MMSLVYVLWMYVVLFAVIGMLRGWAKELLVAFSVIVALTFNHVLRKYVPMVQQLPDDSVSLFWVLSLILLCLVFFGYQTVALIPQSAIQGHTRKTPGCVIRPDCRRRQRVLDCWYGHLLPGPDGVPGTAECRPGTYRRHGCIDGQHDGPDAAALVGRAGNLLRRSALLHIRHCGLRMTLPGAGAGIHVHFIGIGGSGLSAIARMMKESGYLVSGSDRTLSSFAADLQAAGVTVYAGHDARHIQGAAWVVRSSAVPDDNVEVQAARKAGIPVYRRADFLGKFMSDKTGIAVAGTHGKTTTTAMIAFTLSQMHQDPSFIVGGVLNNLGVNARAGAGQRFRRRSG